MNNNQSSSEYTKCDMCDKKTKPPYTTCYTCKFKNASSGPSHAKSGHKCTKCKADCDPKYETCYTCKFDNKCSICDKPCSKQYDKCYKCTFDQVNKKRNSNSGNYSGSDSDSN